MKANRIAYQDVDIFKVVTTEWKSRHKLGEVINVCILSRVNQVTHLMTALSFNLLRDGFK